MGTLDDAHIALIGGGKMGEALIGGVLREGKLEPGQIMVGEPSAVRREYLEETYAVNALASNIEAVSTAEVVLLAVKPQVLSLVLSDLRQVVGPDTLVLSIVAGAKIDTIRTALRTQAVVRVMPNTPGQVGEGISVWTATDETSDEQRAMARRVVLALGQEIYVHEEMYLDMATAVSGSGPAYVFLFIEALIDAGVRLGFPRDLAERLALQTVRGSAAYAQAMNEHVAVLRNQVTSPGGTTAEALQVLERAGLRAAISDAVEAAYRKAQELGKASR